MSGDTELETGVKYADVCIDVSIEKLDKPFSYRIPERLSGIICVGSRVRIPFGAGNTEKKGYVIAIKNDTDYDPDKVKEILGLVEGSMGAEDRSFEMAAFIKDTYGGTLSQALKAVIPAKAKAKPVEIKTLVRKMDRDELLALAAEAARKNQRAKENLLRALIENDRIPSSWISGKLRVSGATVTGLIKSGAAYYETSSEYRKPTVSEMEKKNVSLNGEQAVIVSAIEKDIEEGKAGNYLIHGVTGSGKTEVYIRLAEKCVLSGKQVIFLIPEIALTYQTLARFYSKFGDRVSVLNSSMSAGEKYDQCERARNRDIDIIIGPRSALFTPFPNLGLIIMDEEHESSYKSESTPKYHAREVAKKLCELSGAAFVMGSATPSMESYSAAVSGKFTLFTMKERATGFGLPQTEIIDLRKELSGGNRSMFSRSLKAHMDETLARGEQIMLFLNRRGFSGQVSCRECGKVIMCPHCEVPMALHGNSKLVCHYCGEITGKPSNCPSCGSPYLAAIKAGTEQVEERIVKMYPGVKVLRMDKDTTSAKGSYDRILSSFANGEAQILIGTQMIVKGHDFPNVTLVGILAADLSLGVPDYRASERTFQLLAQACGRAGRGDKPGLSIIQTYQPEHYAVKCAAAQDYEAFYEEESAYREAAGYPPATHMLCIQLFGPDQKKTALLAEELSDVIKSKGPVRILGPAPANIMKVKDYFRYVLYVKNADLKRLSDIRGVSEDFFKDKDMGQMFVQFDLDPMNQI